MELFDGSSPNDVDKKKLKFLFRYLRESIRHGESELHLMSSDRNIRKYLNPKKAEVDQALKALDELLLLDVTPVMLKKHPEVLSTISKVRCYVGNLPKWNLTPEQEREFRQSAEMIRAKGEQIWNKWRLVLGITPTDFKEQCQQLQIIMEEFDAALSRRSISKVHLKCDPTAEYFDDAQKLEDEMQELCKSVLGQQ